MLTNSERAGRATATMQVVVDKGRQLMRVLGPDADIACVTPSVMAGYADQRLSDGVSRHTVKKEIGVLRQAMKAAGLPWDRALMPDLGRVYKPRERWLPVDEYRRLLAALPGARRPYVVVWCNTGLRESELYGLTRADVDWKRRTLRVRGTKTEGSDRVVPLNQDALDALEGRRDPLFPPWGNCQRDLAAAAKRAGIARVSPNDLRRTFASWLANANVSPLVTAKLLGHTSTRMVEQVYARLGHGIQRAAVDSLPSVTSGVAHSADGSDLPDHSDGSSA